jgi:peptidoglycan hydrolase CwlO-like protein
MANYQKRKAIVHTPVKQKMVNQTLQAVTPQSPVKLSGDLGYDDIKLSIQKCETEISEIKESIDIISNQIAVNVETVIKMNEQIIQIEKVEVIDLLNLVELSELDLYNYMLSQSFKKDQREGKVTEKLKLVTELDFKYISPETKYEIEEFKQEIYRKMNQFDSQLAILNKTIDEKQKHIEQLRMDLKELNNQIRFYQNRLIQYDNRLTQT